MNIRSVSTAAGATLALAIVVTSASWTLSALPASLVSQFRPSPSGIIVPEPIGDGTRIVDDGDPTYLTDTILHTVENAGYRNDYDVVRGRAAWYFDNVVPGEYDILATWQARNDAPGKIVYRAIDSEHSRVPLVFPPVDQRKSPQGDSRGGVTWQLLGRVKIQEGHKFWVIARDSAWLLQRPIIADAIMLRPVGQPVCGNGIKETGEECDDGNNDNNDYCTDYCIAARCGDGICQKQEERVLCDSAGQSDEHGDCTMVCEKDCAPAPEVVILANPIEQFNVDAEIPSGGTGHALSMDFTPSDYSDLLPEEVYITRMLFAVEGKSQFVHHLNIIRRKQVVGQALPGVCPLSGKEVPESIFCAEFRDDTLLISAHPENPYAFYHIAVDAQVIREGVQLGSQVRVVMEDMTVEEEPAISGTSRQSRLPAKILTKRMEGGWLTIVDSRGDLCGNGVLEQGEECDEGDRNGTTYSDCTDECTIRTCKENSDCPDGLVCGQGTCVTVPPPRFCYGDYECEEGELCSNRICVSEPRQNNLRVRPLGILKDVIELNAGDSGAVLYMDFIASENENPEDSLINLSYVRVLVDNPDLVRSLTISRKSYFHDAAVELTPENCSQDDQSAANGTIYCADLSATDFAISPLPESPHTHNQVILTANTRSGVSGSFTVTVSGDTTVPAIEAVKKGSGIVLSQNDGDDNYNESEVLINVQYDDDYRFVGGNNDIVSQKVIVTSDYQCSADSDCPGNQVCTGQGLCSQCGNGILDAGEQCDDGTSNGTAASQCTLDCYEGDYCGNGVCDVNFGESCANCPIDCAPEDTELGSTICHPSGGTCKTNADCPQFGVPCLGSFCVEGECQTKNTCEDLCGNGQIDQIADEQCDRGDRNGALFSGCSAKCTLCPVPACAAPPEGCRYVDSGELSESGCPANPCGKLVCENSSSSKQSSSAVACQLKADFNLDGVVNATDLTTIAINLTNPANNLGVMVFSQGDANGDGRVNGADLMIAIGELDRECPVRSSASSIQSSVINTCGNGICDRGESAFACDPTQSDGSGNNWCLNQVYCPQDCYSGAVCGNGILETGEECDDGNNINGDSCTYCRLAPTSQPSNS